MKKIDFTVLIPVYNTKAAELIEAAFSVHKSKQSIKQVYDVLLIDDGSTNEDTLKALKELELQDGFRVHYKKENGGTSSALNKGHELAETEWIAIMGSSDISFANRFKLQVEHLVKNPWIDVLGTQLYSFKETDPKRKPIYTTSHAYERTLIDSPYGWLTNHGTAMYKLSAVNEVGGYTLPGRYQDVDLWKRMALAGKKIRTINTVCYAWRKAGI
jgi:glycosyltransferase involved in cell wall biosynthesis